METIIPSGLEALDGYGHYEDEMVKVNGKWLFSKRKIYNDEWKNKSSRLKIRHGK